MQLKNSIISLVLGLIIGIFGTHIFSSNSSKPPVVVTALQSPADIKNASIAVETHFQNKVDSLVQTNTQLQQKVGSTKSELQKAKSDNKVLLDLVDTLLAYEGNEKDTATRLADCDSVSTAVHELIASSNERDSLCENLNNTLQAQVSNRDSVIGTQNEQYNTLKLSFDKSLAQQDVLTMQSQLYEKQIKGFRVKNKLLSAGVFILTGIELITSLKTKKEVENHMKEKTIISSATLLTSLVAYWYAKAAGKDAAPFVMLGGFVGSIIGEAVADHVNKEPKNKKD